MPETLGYELPEYIDSEPDDESKEEENKKSSPPALFIQAPYGGDSLQFRGEPTSLMYATSVFADKVHSGKVAGLTDSDLKLMNPPSNTPEFYDELKQYIRENKPKVIAVSCTTPSSRQAKLIAGVAKLIDPSIVTIIGGAHERDSETKSAEEKNYIDFSAEGDGEYMLDKLLQIIYEDPEATPMQIKQKILERRDEFTGLDGKGLLHFKDNNGQNQTIQLSQKMINLDHLPPPPRHLLSQEKWSKYYGIFRKRGQDVKTAQIMSCRGCPRRCAYCSESVDFNPRDAQKAIDEIQAAYDQGYRAVFFDDSTFTAFTKKKKSKPTDVLRPLESVEPIFDKLKELEMEWGCQTRVDRIIYRNEVDEPEDPERIVREMKEGGCSYVYFGIESADPGLLEAMLKGTTVETAQKAIDMVDKYGMRMGLSLLFGTQGKRFKTSGGERVQETEETVNKTFDFVKKNIDEGKNIVLVSMNLSTYYPGTLMTKSLSDEDLRRLAAESYPPDQFTYDFENMSSADLMKLAFEKPIVNRGYPWNRFEEGQGHHPSCVTKELAQYIIEKGVREIGEVLQGQDLYMSTEIYEAIRKGENPNFVDFNHASLTTPRLNHKQKRFTGDLFYNQEAHRADMATMFYGDQDDMNEWGIDEVETFERARGYVADIFGLEHAGALTDRRLQHIAFAPNTTEAINTAYQIAMTVDPKIMLPSANVVVTNAENFSIKRIPKIIADQSNPDGRDGWSSYQDWGSEYFGSEHVERSQVEPIKTGVEVREAEIISGDPSEEIIKRVDENTKMVIFSHVIRDNGKIVDVKGICEQIRAINPDCWIVVDGAQAFGTFPGFKVEEIGCDFYVGTPHKTLNCYPFGVMYMNDRAMSGVQSYLDSLYAGEIKMPVRDHMFALAFGPDEEQVYKMWEENAGSTVLSPNEIRSLTANFDPELSGEEPLTDQEKATLSEGRILGYQNLQTLPGRVARKLELAEANRRELKNRAIEALGASFGDGIEILSPQDQDHSNFILSFRLSGKDNREIVDRLWHQDPPIMLSYISRSDLIRISFDQFNKPEDIDYLVESLQKTM